MPDVWTKHPEIVRDLLKEAGFKCGVEPRFLKGRDPAWTCAFDGKRLKGDLYIHHVDRLRSEVAPPDAPLTAAAMNVAGDWGLPALALALAVLVAGWRGARPRRRQPPP